MAVRQIQAALEGDYNPTVIQYRGHVVFFARQPMHGWGYKIIWPSESANISTTLFMDSTTGSKAEVMARAIIHLADCVRKTGEKLDTVADLFDCIPDKRLRQDKWRDFCSRCRESEPFQLRFRHAMDALQLSRDAAYLFTHMAPGAEHIWGGTEHLFANAGSLI